MYSRFDRMQQTNTVDIQNFSAGIWFAMTSINKSSHVTLKLSAELTT